MESLILYVVTVSKSKEVKDNKYEKNKYEKNKGNTQI